MREFLRKDFSGRQLHLTLPGSHYRFSSNEMLDYKKPIKEPLFLFFSTVKFGITQIGLVYSFISLWSECVTITWLTKLKCIHHSDKKTNKHKKNSCYICFSPLQTIVSKYGSQFRGNSQHDALEFLLWLLDRVHEDVNLACHNNNNNETKALGQVRIWQARGSRPVAAVCSTRQARCRRRVFWCCAEFCFPIDLLQT